MRAAMYSPQMSWLLWAADELGDLVADRRELTEKVGEALKAVFVVVLLHQLAISVNCGELRESNTVTLAR